MECRINNRESPYLFSDTLLILLHGDALPHHVPIERDDPGAPAQERRSDAPRGEAAGQAEALLKPKNKLYFIK